VTEEYSPEEERGIIWNDPDVGIGWPVKEPILSKRDAELPRLRDADNDSVSRAEPSEQLNERRAL